MTLDSSRVFDSEKTHYHIVNIQDLKLKKKETKCHHESTFQKKSLTLFSCENDTCFLGCSPMIYRASPTVLSM